MKPLMPFFTLLIIIQCTVFSLLGIAQTSNFIYYGIENGLPQSGIHNIVQDRKGNLWMGTMDGVSKYNGQAFKNYSKDEGMAENWVTASLLDRKGNVWFGHWAGGISCYDYLKDSIIKFNTKDINKIINTICEDKSGNIWFGTEGMGIVKFNPDDKEGKSFFNLSAQEGLSGNNVSSIICDKNGLLWIATNGGLTKYNPYEKNVDKSIEYITVKGGLPSNDLTDLIQASNGNLWIGTRDKGLAKLDISSKNIQCYGTGRGLPSDYVKTVYEDADKNIWVGTNGGGLSKYISNSALDKLLLNVFKTYTVREGLCNNKILSIFQDREKNLWIGTFIGLNQLRTEHFEIYDASQGLTNTLIWAIIKDKTGYLWMGTENGLVKYNPTTRTGLQEIETYTEKEGLSNNNIVALFEDNEGYIWASTWGQGVCRLNKITGKIEKFNTSNGLPSNEVTTIIADKDENIWIGMDKGGLTKYDPHTKNFENFTSANGLGNNRVYTSYRDKENNLWFGTLGGGITKFNGKIFRTYSEKYGLNHTFVTCITEDYMGNILAGTYGGGIYKFDGTSFAVFRIKPDGRSFSPCLMFTDKSSNLWVGTSSEIDKYDQKTKKLEVFGEENGFLGIEANPNAVCSDNEGNIWFGSIIGAVKYNEKKNKLNTIEPLTEITNLKVFSQNIGIPINPAFEYNQNQITFNYIGVSLTNPLSVRYQFKLQGFDKEWSLLAKENFTTYTNLVPGDYTFLVKASNNDGVWNSQPASYSFRIKPPVWQTPWFLILAFIAAGFLVYGVFVFRLRAIQAEKRLLETMVEERTEELKLQNAELERLSIVASETDNGVLIFDADFNLEWLNDGYTRMTGFSLEEFKEYRGGNLKAASKNPQIAGLIEQSKEEKKAVQYETINATISGEEIWIQSNLTPIFDNEGKLKKMVVIEIDINERKKAEKIITKKNDELMEMSSVLRKQKDQVEKQSKVIHQKNKDITDSIIYAKQIQDAILPSKRKINTSLKDVFIFYQPRDIVSGDFYWFTKTVRNGNPVYIIAAADCTGHGVPGAFMSMIGHTLLNQIVHERKVFAPSQILGLLDKFIKISLKQENFETVSWDGMDIAVCSFELDITTNEFVSVEFSGAFRPLYHLHDGVIDEIAPDKIPIGGYNADEKKDFTNHKIAIKKGDCFYIFSDGYPDQFGGPDGKKFMTRRFKNLLLSVQGLPMDEQGKVVEKEFNGWKGKQDQVDDIMVIGVRV